MRSSRGSILCLSLGVMGVAFGCIHDASVCVSTDSVIVQYNPDCIVDGSIGGCGADSNECCQFCGFENYPPCTDHEFTIDVVQTQPVDDPSTDGCVPELHGLIGGWLIYHVRAFFDEHDIVLEGNLDVAVDETPFGSFVEPNRFVVAEQDFDGNEKSLISPGLYDKRGDGWNGGQNRYMGVGSLEKWPQSRGVPSNIADATVADISTRGISPDDDCGIFGQNRDKQDTFFCVSDTRSSRETYWEFDVAGYASLQLSIDMGGISDFGSDVNNGGFSSSDTVVFSVELDGCAQTAFDLTAVEDPGFSTRPMDNGGASGGGRLLEVSGDQLVTKRLAEDHVESINTYLDKAPSDGPGAGDLDTFTTPIVCPEGSVLTLHLLANLDREAMVFDNIKLTGIPSEYLNSNRRQMKKTTASATMMTNRARDLYYSYWYSKDSYYGRMRCSYCAFDNNDADFYRLRRGRRLSTHHGHSLHSDFEAFVSFHLTNEVTKYLSETGKTCLGPTTSLSVYFAQNT